MSFSIGSACERKHELELWRRRVGKNSSFAEAVYHALIGLTCAWKSGLFRFLLAVLCCAVSALFAAHVHCLYLVLAFISSALILGLGLVSLALARLIKLG